jgi:hypothetical protein
MKNISLLFLSKIIDENIMLLFTSTITNEIFFINIFIFIYLEFL